MTLDEPLPCLFFTTLLSFAIFACCNHPDSTQIFCRSCRLFRKSRNFEKVKREKPQKNLDDFRQKDACFLRLYQIFPRLPHLFHLHNTFERFPFTNSYSHFPHCFPHRIFPYFSMGSGLFPQALPSGIVFFHLGFPLFSLDIKPFSMQRLPDFHEYSTSSTGKRRSSPSAA